MTAFKVKTKESAGKNLTRFEGQPSRGSVTIQAVFYSGQAPAQKLYLYDADGDLFMFPVPGQIEEKIVTPEIPVTVKLPLYYFDEGEKNEIIVFGEN